MRPPLPPQQPALMAFRRRIDGSVTTPVDATLADAEPEIEPNNADERTETFAALLLASSGCNGDVHETMAGFPAFRIAPKITKTATTDTGNPGQLTPQSTFCDDHSA